jgi:hypothetical protein
MQRYQNFVFEVQFKQKHNAIILTKTLELLQFKIKKGFQNRTI